MKSHKPRGPTRCAHLLRDAKAFSAILIFPVTHFSSRSSLAYVKLALSLLGSLRPIWTFQIYEILIDESDPKRS